MYRFITVLGICGFLSSAHGQILINNIADFQQCLMDGHSADHTIDYGSGIPPNRVVTCQLQASPWSPYSVSASLTIADQAGVSRLLVEGQVISSQRDVILQRTASTTVLETSDAPGDSATSGIVNLG